MTAAADMLARIRGARAAYSRNDTKAVKPKEGKTRYRILQQPGEAGFKFWHDLGVHWIKSDPNGKPLAVHGCVDAAFEEECKICTLIQKVIAGAPDDETVKIAKTWFPKRSVLVQALVRSGDAKSETPIILELTRGTFDMVMSIYENFFEENEVSLFDAEKGLDIIIERKGKGLDTEYQVSMTSKSVAVPESAIEGMVDLEAFIRKEYFRPGDEQKAITAITRITGVTLHAGALGGPSKTSGLLTGSGSKVVDADLDLEDEVEVEKEKPKKPAAAKAPAKEPAKAPKKEEKPADDEFDEDLDVSDVLDELDGLDD